ncbi:Ig-like domain repeat protein [Rhodococcus spelaei]|uniref:Ig-like domain repeat protein n=1 Tax=Rhodococcus spelaei TaxID=2546320 RepID=A0A541B9D0_9NOCA|nr:Ig-like domain-containing protein [Rhodococcus spelaei]TQF68858.1 Ig-like domain repeat protein [Rhodococcus spelaei]
MSRPVIRRVTAAVSAAAVVALGLGVGGGVASAAQTSATVTATNIVATKALLGTGSVHPGDVVTYRTSFSVNSAIDRYLNKITDVHPAGFTYVPGSAKVSTSSVTPSVDDANNKVSVSNSASAWMLSKTVGRTVSFEVSYKVPDNAPAGTFDSGLTFDVNTFGSTQTFNPIGVTVDVLAPAATTTTLTVQATATTGQAVDLTASVSPSTAGGTVQFKDGATDIGSPVTVVGGSATLSQSFATAGAHSITAVYSGGTGFAGSTSAASTVNVSAPDVATTTQLTVPSTAVTGQPVDLKAVVSPVPSGGSVQFKDGAANIGGPVNLTNGVATLSQAFTSAGAKSVTAVFSGIAGFTGSTSQASTVTVSNPAPNDVATTTAVAAPGSAKVGVAVDLSATVSPATAAGTVQFRDGGSNIGGPVTVTNGVATLSQTFTAAGAHSVTAVFSGAAGFLGSTSQASTVTVSEALPSDVATSTVLTAPASATAGVAVDLKAAVSPATAGGTVQFKDGDTPIGAPVNVTNGQATLSYPFTATGSRNITAVYSGAAGFTGSTSAKSVVEVAAAPGGGTGGGTGSLGSLFGSS